MILISSLDNYADYTIVSTSYARYQVVDNQGIEGTDTITNIETLRFADQDIDITPSGLEL